MNLYWRLFCLIVQKIIRLVITRLGNSRLGLSPCEASILEMRCWPHDCDINMHMTNSRFASFGDLARIGVLFDQGMMLRLMREKSAPILVAQNTIFFREIPIGRRFTIKSQILGWDDRFWFFQHDFIQGGQVKATTYAKGFFVRHKKVQGFTQILGPHAMPSPELPLAVKHWSESCTELFQASKQREDQAR